MAKLISPWTKLICVSNHVYIKDIQKQTDKAIENLDSIAGKYLQKKEISPILTFFKYRVNVISLSEILFEDCRSLKS